MQLPLGRIFQIAYVTNDMEQAKAEFKRSHGVDAWMTTADIDKAGDASVEAALSWAGAVQFELIRPRANALPMYTDWIADANGFALRFHHLGLLADTEAEQQRAYELCLASGQNIVFDSGPRHAGRWFYADARATMQHYLEVVTMTDAGRAFDASIPRSTSTRVSGPSTA